VWGAVLSLNQPSYRDEHLFVDLRRQLVKLCGQTLTLTRKEYCLLALLVKDAGEVVPREIMLTELRRPLPETPKHALDVHIGWLRRRLAVYADQYLETVYGAGYRFRPKDSAPMSSDIKDVPD
jgi:two-component system KDP operon response regulator KdpE